MPENVSLVSIVFCGVEYTDVSGNIDLTDTMNIVAPGEYSIVRLQLNDANYGQIEFMCENAWTREVSIIFNWSDGNYDRDTLILSTMYVDWFVKDIFNINNKR